MPRVEYIFPYGEEGDAKRALLRERRRIERDSGEQKDLIAGSLKREADLIHKRGAPRPNATSAASTTAPCGITAAASPASR